MSELKLFTEKMGQTTPWAGRFRMRKNIDIDFITKKNNFFII